MSRRYESHANRSFSACAASPATEESLRPMLRTVSIIPGIENFAPDRTLTSSGSSGWPSRLPMAFSSAVRCSLTSARSSAGSSPEARYTLQASVVIVKPGGTGSPRFVISARFAPLPPSRSLRSLLPSVKS
jgi:hypothetical protein